jgi:hypothetical protein
VKYRHRNTFNVRKCNPSVGVDLPPHCLVYKAMNHKAFSITTAASINKSTMGAAFPPKATFPLPLNESEVTAFEDAQHRALPASFEELLALHSEQSSTHETIANDPDLTIEDLKFPLRTEWSHKCHIYTQPPCLRPKEPSTGYSVLSRRRARDGQRLRDKPELRPQ